MTSMVIVSAVRTAIGKFGGSLKDMPAVALGAHVIKHAIERAGLSHDVIDDVFLGNVLQAGLGQNPARQAWMKSGGGITTPATSINMVCGSGLQSVILAAQSVAAGSSEIVLAGGMENMSLAPYVLGQARWGYRMGDNQVVDTVVNDGLSCAINHYHMGITAENVAKKYSISRQEQDEFAWLSQKRADSAQRSGAFESEIVPLTLKSKKGESSFSCDEYVRGDTTLESLSQLKPVFDPTEGTVTAGNASGINDGAAAMIIMSES